jgi:hypothetical protein
MWAQMGFQENECHILGDSGRDHGSNSLVEAKKRRVQDLFDRSRAE